MNAAVTLFHPRLTLRTFHRGDGLLGMHGGGDFGPRGSQVTVAWIDAVYTEGDHRWEYSLPGTESLQPIEIERRIGKSSRRDPAAEAHAVNRAREAGLKPLPGAWLQWRGTPPNALPLLWSMTREEDFGDFWADHLPLLQAEGWRVIVLPGFAHESVPVDSWHLVISPHSPDNTGKEVVSVMRHRAPGPTDLSRFAHNGSWLISMGIEVGGERYDLVPLLTTLLRRDSRWADADKVAAIDDEEAILLRLPGGKRIETPAAPIKAIVSHLLDLLTVSRRKDGPLRLSCWDACRLDALRLALENSWRARAGALGGWMLHNAEGLQAMARRLRQAGKPEAVAQPQGLGITLRPYQLHGVGWLQYLREQELAGILADDMGLGKTAQTLAHVLLEKQAGRLDRPALIVVPTSLMFNWQAEAKRIAPDLRILALQGPDRKALHACMAQYDMVLTTYALLWRDTPALAAQPFHLLILDEAQTVKNAASRCASAVRRLQARHRLCLTGTPLENHLGELWAQFDFLLPGFLGDARSFQRVWRKPIEVNGERERARLLAQRVRPFILRRRREDVAPDLPPRTDIVRRLQLSGSQRELYESVRVAADSKVRQILARKGFDGARMTIMDALLKLRQVCCDPALLKDQPVKEGTERAKIAMLRDMLPELVAEGHRMLIFSQFTEFIGLIARELDTIALPWLRLTGETPPSERGEVVSRFQRGETPIFLVSLKAGGVGLNLTAADTVILMDPWWNPAVEEQAIARAHRIGQTRQVLVIRLVIEGSIEERILELQAHKGALADGILGNDGALSPKFGQAELDALMAPLNAPGRG